MKNIVKYLLLACSASVLLSSCLQEEFPMNGTVTDEQITGSEQGAAAAANGMIGWTNESMSVTGEHTDFGMPSICLYLDAIAPDVAIEDYGYDPECLNLRVGYQLEETGYFPLYAWYYFYKMINIANSNLTAFGSPADGSDVESLTPAQAAGVGQSLAYRAMSYYYLSSIFEYRGSLSGEKYIGLTVPWIGPETTELESRNNKRVPFDEMFNDHILRDLENALVYLESYARPSKAYVDAAVVNGFLARAYLWYGDYAKAAAAARKAIDLNGGSVLTEQQWTDPQAGFNTLSTPAWIWGVDVTSDDDCVKSGICNWVSMLAPEATFGYAGQNNSASAKLCDARLYASIPDSDWRKKSWIDPDREKYEYRYNHDEDWLYGVPDLTGIKFRPGSGNTGNSAVGAVADFPLMRLEEMYLIEAEATGMSNLAEGKALLEAFVQTRNANYTSKASDATSFQKEVFNQAQIEFWGEGIIYFYYKRLNMPTFRGYEGTNHFDVCRFNFPDGNCPAFTPQIPLSEINTNLALADQQNPSVQTMYPSEPWRDQ